MKKHMIIWLMLGISTFSFGQSVEVEIATVFRSLAIFADVAKSESEGFAPSEESGVYAFMQITAYYSEYEADELLILLLKADENDLQPLSEFTLALLYITAAVESRLPTIPEILDELLPGKGEDMGTLYTMLQDDPGNDFEAALDILQQEHISSLGTQL